jgi:alpha-1,3-glucan synthase
MPRSSGSKLRPTRILLGKFLAPAEMPALMTEMLISSRMDDLDSAVYYSAWNACIAETTKRFPIDIYHINDYHGSAAPLYLLPETIPCCLSLHNAEFQGLWPMRSPKESEEVCKVYNLSPEIVQKYVQFGEVFNLLHAGASYLRVHQKGFGAVGVSNKYGARSYARYPIFWGLKVRIWSSWYMGSR